MGCISSKVLARSISFHQEKRRGSHRNTNGILEDLIISKNGREQYLALICAANPVANEQHSKSLTSNTSSKLVTDAADTKTNDKWEITSEPSQEAEKQIGIHESRRSKSWHWVPEHIVSSLAEENSSEFEDIYELSSKGTVRSRSFHTVEEYDALVNRLWLSTSHKYQQGEFDDDNSGNDMETLVSDSVSGTSHHIDVMSSAIKEIQPPCLHSSYPEKADKNMDTRVLNPAAESEVSTSDDYNSSAGRETKGDVLVRKTDVSESAVQGRNISGKGNKRKAVAKRLESLKIPSDIECPAIPSHREWLPADGIYSPRSYVTPKFGSYSLKTTSNANESSMNSIFSPELVSAFEQCLQNLEAEEEDILRQIMENLAEESGGDIQSKERTSPCKEV